MPIANCQRPKQKRKVQSAVDRNGKELMKLTLTLLGQGSTDDDEMNRSIYVPEPNDDQISKK